MTIFLFYLDSFLPFTFYVVIDVSVFLIVDLWLFLLLFSSITQSGQAPDVKQNALILWWRILCSTEELKVDSVAASCRRRVAEILTPPQLLNILLSPDWDFITMSKVDQEVVNLGLLEGYPLSVILGVLHSQNFNFDLFLNVYKCPFFAMWQSYRIRCWMKKVVSLSVWSLGPKCYHT